MVGDMDPKNPNVPDQGETPVAPKPPVSDPNKDHDHDQDGDHGKGPQRPLDPARQSR